jgi:hypothetical protein
MPVKSTFVAEQRGTARGTPPLDKSPTVRGVRKTFPLNPKSPKTTICIAREGATDRASSTRARLARSAQLVTTAIVQIVLGTRRVRFKALSTVFNRLTSIFHQNAPCSEEDQLTICGGAISKPIFILNATCFKRRTNVHSQSR